MLGEDEAAKTAATNGWTFANSVARDGPTRWIGREPEQVGQEERPDDREREADPDEVLSEP